MSDVASMPAAGRHWMGILVALALFAGAMGAVTSDASPVGAYADDAMYVILAKSLATGQGYRSLNVPGAPYNTHFPPGYPAVLSLLWRAGPAFPANVALFRAFNVACLAAIAVGVAQFARQLERSEGWAVAVSLISVVSIPVLVLSTMLLSETLFIALLLFLLLRLEIFTGVSDAPARASQALALGLLTGACILVRTHGVALLPAVLVVLGVQGRWRSAAAYTFAVLACIVPWQLWCATHQSTVPVPLLGEYGSYTSWWVRGFHDVGWQMIPRTLSRNMAESSAMLAVLFSPLRSPAARVATLVALAAVAVAGVTASWRRIPVTLLFLVTYLSLVAAWPSQPSRFIWGAWPLLIGVLASGARFATTGAPLANMVRVRHSMRLLVAASVVWITLGYGAYELRGVRGHWWASIPRHAATHIQPAVAWTNARTQVGDVIAAEDEGPIYLYTGRKTVPVRAFTAQQYLADSPPSAQAHLGLAPILDSYPVRAVVVYTSIGNEIAGMLSAGDRPRLTLRDAFPGGFAYAVLHP